MRFLFSRRWVLFGAAVVVLALGCWWLGQWQFDRLEERRADNTRTERNLDLPPAPVQDVLAVGRPVDPDDEWRRVTATGTYLAGQDVVVRYQTRDGAPGVDVVTPLRVDGSGASGAVVLVDRGWLATQNAGGRDIDVPPAPGGPVTVTGWVRADGTGRSTDVEDRSTRAISSAAIGEALGLTVYGGFLDLAEQEPALDPALRTTEPPDLSEGPHFFYGLQWWFFAALAVFGFGYLAYDERRGGPGGRGARRRRAQGDDPRDAGRGGSGEPEPHQQAPVG